MWELEAHFSVVTPLFLGGADPVKDEELSLRVPSLKGALRFWYRAAALARLGSLARVRNEEAAVFGSTKTGQSLFLARVEDVNLKTVNKGEKVLGGIAYLGYGVANWNSKARAALTTRPYIKPGSSFKLRLLLRPQKEINQDYINDLKLAVQALGLFGGLGARSRRGLGSLGLMSLKENGQVIWSPPRTIDELKHKYEEFFRKLNLPDNPELPEYTAFSRHSRVVIVAADRNPERLLNTVGQAMNHYRSYRKDKNYPRDHDVAREIANHKQPQEHPVRLAFGLPHNYFFSSDKSIVNVSGQKGEEEYRRASPLFIHIHPLEQEPAAVLTFLPANFLPSGVEILMTAHGNRVKVPSGIKTVGDFHPITDFMDSFSQRMEVKIGG
ncbi:MAG: type III-B CRISPR module RAMP protein Cmr1 [Syntrophomonadaceae bacterium]|nr:type III-B CRISPR module RAMP protein Cmr1 [Syntrophomonadaceae bacterium]